MLSSYHPITLSYHHTIILLNSHEGLFTSLTKRQYAICVAHRSDPLHCGSRPYYIIRQRRGSDVQMDFWKISWLQHPPKKAATPELHSASRGLAVPPRPIRTAALRRAGEKTGVGAPPRRGGSVEIALPGTVRLAPGVAGNSKQLQIPPSPRAL